jgi:hypothetical protein
MTDQPVRHPFRPVPPVTPYQRAQHNPLDAQPRRPDWQPPKWEPVRPGADDHKQWKSRGV